MLINSNRARTLLKDFDFHSLFIEELGWDKYQFLLNVGSKRPNGDTSRHWPISEA